MKLRILTSLLFGYISLLGSAHADTSASATIGTLATLEDINGQDHICVDQDAYVFPVSNRSTTSVKLVYGDTESGFASIYRTPELIATAEGVSLGYGTPPELLRLFRKSFKKSKRAACQSDGYVEFSNLKPGEYYVIVPIFWKDFSAPQNKKTINLSTTYRDHFIKIPTNYRGGTMMAKVNVEPGETIAFQIENIYED